MRKQLKFSYWPHTAQVSNKETALRPVLWIRIRSRIRIQSDAKLFAESDRESDPEYIISDPDPGTLYHTIRIE